MTVFFHAKLLNKDKSKTRFDKYHFMTLPHFLKEHQSKLKSIAKLNVRDLDEVSKNSFVAYVDEGKDSFDVQMEFNTKKELKNTACDCATGGICIHIIALAHFISENKSEKNGVKKTVKRKLTETDEILETLDNETLRNWVSEILNKNKELAFAFKNQFVTSTFTLDKEYIKKTVQDSIQSIIGKRRTVNTNEVKKIVDTLNVSLKPILEVIFSKVSKQNIAFLETLVSELEEFHFNYYITSIRVTKLIENIYDSHLKSLFTIKDYEEWQKATQYFVSKIFEDSFYLKDLEFVRKIYDFSTTNELQKNYIVDLIDDQFTKLHNAVDENVSLLSYEIEHFVLQVFSENNKLSKHIHKFSTRRFRNEYNLLLINELVRLNDITLAEKYCIEQINYNFKQEYDLPYVSILISIYKKNQDHSKLVLLLIEYGKYDFSIDHYEYIKEYAPIEKFKKYRQAVLTHAKNSYQNGNISAFDFYFEVKKREGSASELFEMLLNSRNLELIDKYKEIAIPLDEDKFITLISRLPFFYSQNEKTIETLANYIIESIEITKLNSYLKKIPTHLKNRIILQIIKNLNFKINS